MLLCIQLDVVYDDGFVSFALIVLLLITSKIMAHNSYQSTFLKPNVSCKCLIAKHDRIFVCFRTQMSVENLYSQIKY